METLLIIRSCKVCKYHSKSQKITASNVAVPCSISIHSQPVNLLKKIKKNGHESSLEDSVLLLNSSVLPSSTSVQGNQYCTKMTRLTQRKPPLQRDSHSQKHKHAPQLSHTFKHTFPHRSSKLADKQPALLLKCKSAVVLPFVIDILNANNLQFSPLIMQCCWYRWNCCWWDFSAPFPKN